MLSRRLALVLAGQFDQAGIDPPRMYPWDRVRVAERAYERAGASWGDSPRTVAARLGIVLTVAPIRGCGGETASGDVVLVAMPRDRQDRGLCEWHGLAHVLLRREGWRHSEADVWLLTMELACPHRVLGRPDDELLAGSHAPSSAVRRWLPLARSLGRQATDEAA